MFQRFWYTLVVFAFREDSQHGSKPKVIPLFARSRTTQQLHNGSVLVSEIDAVNMMEMFDYAELVAVFCLTVFLDFVPYIWVG